MKTKRLALPCAFIFSLIFLVGCNDRLFDNPLDPNAETRAYEILATLQAVNVVPVDLTFSGDVLWVVDAQSRILSLNYNSGALIRELDFPQSVSGIAYDGKDLWLGIKNSNQVVQVNIVNGAQIKALNLLRGDVGCLAYEAGRLYVADKLSNTILVVNIDSGTIEKTISQPGFTINGLVFDGSNFWTIDASQNKIFRLDEAGTMLNVYQPPSRSAVGLAFSQGFIWCGDQMGKIYKLKFP
jgi:outer membrane protein assembly factor BamB